ncbi:alpha/beta fold hydrolase [Agromyces larvae]|uniref:Alpha/beta fold hydrolase n=1 Tax=Agromyces larvae TaxID=2929802 RepID=A0ABY4C090_9MICO|nr:alpha/beta fold hydrolase [Agromyces larvae]UOE44901.1 alpha/beta fold hydrolase [Agromyces larvae]
MGEAGRDRGAAERMPRARVVLVHGIRTSATMWRNQLAPLRAHGIEVDAIDLPGHGTRLDESFSLDAAYAAIDAALAGTQAQRETDATDRPDAAVPRLLVGLSLGAYLAIGYAAEHPGRIDGLVAASAGTRPRGAGLAGYRALAAAIRRLPDRGRSLNDAMAALFLPPDAADDIIAGGVALDVMADALAAVGTVDLEAALGGIDVPVWFVNGRWDHFRFEERRMLRAARDARLVVVPGATHLVSLVQPEHFTAAVLDAVAELERRAARERRIRAPRPPSRVES